MRNTLSDPPVPQPGEGKRGEQGYLGYLLRQASVAVRTRMERDLSEEDVTPPMDELLARVSERKERIAENPANEDRLLSFDSDEFLTLMLRWLNAFVSIDEERARRQATLADDAIASKMPLGPLHGVAITIKSSIDVAGLACEAGTRQLILHGDRNADLGRAAGLDEDIERHPDRYEHFGIATVEAMSAGAVPIVIDAAGQIEIVEQGVSGYRFGSPDGLVAHTERLIADPRLRATLSAAAERRARAFGWDAFVARVGDEVARLA